MSKRNQNRTKIDFEAAQKAARERMEKIHGPITGRMSLRDARMFLMRNDKATAIATGRWPFIQRQWEMARQIVETDKAIHNVMFQSPQATVSRPEVKEALRLKMKEAAARRKAAAENVQ